MWPVPYSNIRNIYAMGGVPDKEKYAYALAKLGIKLDHIPSDAREALIAHLIGMNRPFSDSSLMNAINPQTQRAQQ